MAWRLPQPYVEVAVRAYLGYLFVTFAKKCLSRPADIRFGQFEVCGTCDYVVQSHVTSFGVGFHEVPVAWRLPHPYTDLAVPAFLGRHFGIFAPK